MSTSASTEQNNSQQAATPVAVTPDPMENILRQAAQNMDEGREVHEEELHQPSTAKDKAAKKPASEGSEQESGNEPAAKKDEKKAAEKNEQKPGEKKPGESEQKQDGKDGDSAYAKAKKDAERFDRNWQEFQRKQEEFKQQQQQFQQQQREFEERVQRQSQRPAGPVKDSDGYTATDWDKAAAEWEKAGKYELADGAKDKAKQLREQERAGAAQGGADRGAVQLQRKPEETPQTPEFRAKWNGHLAELKATEEFADLGNKESDLFKETAKVLNSDQRFSTFNDGIRLAANIAKLQLEAGSVPGLRKQLEEQTKELEKLRKATSPSSGGAEERGKARSFEEQSPAEQEAQLRRNAELVDAQ